MSGAWQLDQRRLAARSAAPGSRDTRARLGRNGAGKTTLLRIVAGQEFPSAGSRSSADHQRHLARRRAPARLPCTCAHRSAAALA
ncbi:MAG: ATP-binding cassette domain-containing protein [Streptosporangiaceae bacterium]